MTVDVEAMLARIASKTATLDNLTPTTTATTVLDGLTKYSNAPSSDISINLGLAPMPHQKVVIEAVQSGYRSLLVADQPGVGKTLAAIGSVETAQAYPALYIVPPTLTLNWQREIQRAVPHRSVAIISGTRPTVVPTVDIVIVPDSVVYSWIVVPDPTDKRKTIAGGPIAQRQWASLVVDEAHRLKSEAAKRTKAVVKLSKVMRPESLRLLLTGTPMVNRPDELVAPLSILGVINTVFGGRSRFLGRYCIFNNWGSVTGAQNGKELYERLTGSVMIRRLREQVLSLPSKSRVIVRAPMNTVVATKYRDAEKNLVAFLRNERDDDKYSVNVRSEAIVLLNTLRRLSGEAKVDAVVQRAEELLADGEQVFIAAWHTDVVAKVWAALHRHSVVQVVGGMTAEDKQAAVDAFQSGAARVLIGNIEAAGVGLTLTAARHIIVAELPWNPAALQQVEDRLHRIGQKREVTSSIMVSDWEGGSVDERVWALIDKKALMVNEIIDGIDEGMVIDNDESINSQLLDSYR